MDFFSNCKTKEEAKQVYRRLSMHFHPDKGGDKDLMIHLQQQYHALRFIDNCTIGRPNAFASALGNINYITKSREQQLIIEISNKNISINYLNQENVVLKSNLHNREMQIASLTKNIMDLQQRLNHKCAYISILQASINKPNIFKRIIKRIYEKFS